MSDISTNPDSEAPTVLVSPPPQKAGIIDFLGNSPEGLAAIFTTDSDPLLLEEGSIIGNYLLIKKIADGGFGTVWHAEQQEPVTRDVALKLIRPDKSSPEIISRFERERQALAMMDHENIATVYDAGEHEGQLFFAMEYVPGQPITQHVKDHSLSLKERIALFIPVCRAVHHAHTKFILHRDLKPSNVLVTLKDNKPTPKVIDFGIAKALADDHAMLRADTGALPVTQMGYVLGTPQYMSPEQARGDLDIDAASDTYTLGVILYELLVGEPPVTKAELAKQSGHYAMLDHIINYQPSLPSTLWQKAGTGQTRTLDSSMGKDPRRISRQMREDLDWIILHALEKNRTRRYSSADALADDLQRHLDNEPVSVGPPSFGYQLRKFYLRHKTAFVAAAFVLGAIVAGGGVAVWQWQEAVEARGLEATARQRAEKAAAAENFARQQAETSQRLAEAREKDAEAARDLEARAHRASDLARSEAEDLITFMLFDMRDRLEPLNRTPLLAAVAEKAESYYQAQATTLGDNDEQTRNRAAMYQNKGLIELAQGKNDAALTSFHAFLKIADDRARRDPQSEETRSDLALAHNRLGMALQAKGELPAAQLEYHKEQALVTKLLQQKPDATLWRLQLATTHEHLGDLSDAPLPHFQASLDLLEKLHKEEPQSVEIIRALATAHEKLGRSLSNLKRPKEALPHFDQELLLLESLGPELLIKDVRLRRAKAIALQNQGATLLVDNRPEEALPILKNSVNSSQAIFQEDSTNQTHLADLVAVENALATCHWEMGQLLLRQGTSTSIKTAQQQFVEGRDVLKTDFPGDPKSAAAMQKQKQRFDQALAEVHHLLR